MARDLRRRQDEAIRITTAGTSRRDDISARQRRYVLSMGLRTACFVAAVPLWQVSPWLSGVLIAAALLLPYVAVVMANAVASRSDEFELRSHVSPHQELSSGPESARDSRSQDL
jgi:hypothetical protein